MAFTLISASGRRLSESNARRCKVDNAQANASTQSASPRCRCIGNMQQMQQKTKNEKDETREAIKISAAYGENTHCSTTKINRAAAACDNKNNSNSNAWLTSYAKSRRLESICCKRQQWRGARRTMCLMAYMPPIGRPGRQLTVVGALCCCAFLPSAFRICFCLLLFLLAFNVSSDAAFGVFVSVFALAVTILTLPLFFQLLKLFLFLLFLLLFFIALTAHWTL